MNNSIVSHPALLGQAAKSCGSPLGILSLTDMKHDLKKNPNRNVIGVELYPEGCIMHAERKVGNPTGEGGGVRGSVATFSKASRRRFRLMLLTSGVSGGWTSFGVTVTIPGPVLATQVSRELWKVWCRRVELQNWVVIWRAEMQQREAMHWHCLVAVETSDPGKTACEIKQSWFSVLDSRFPFVKYGRPGARGPTGEPATHGPLSWWPGSARHAVQVEYQDNGRGAWYRYLSDHASKVKKDQVGENIGRHWGVVGRKHLLRISGKLLEMDRRQYAKFRRAYERLATPRIPDERAPFGKRSGFKCKRGRWGSAVSFVRPDTVRRLADYAKGKS